MNFCINYKKHAVNSNLIYSISLIVFFCVDFGVGPRMSTMSIRISRFSTKHLSVQLLQKYLESQSLDFSSILMNSFYLLLQHILDTLPRYLTSIRYLDTLLDTMIVPQTEFPVAYEHSSKSNSV